MWKRNFQAFQLCITHISSVLTINMASRERSVMFIWFYIFIEIKKHIWLYLLLEGANSIKERAIKEGELKQE